MFFAFKLCICQDPKIARAYTAQIQKFAHFSLVSLSPRTRSRPGAERIRLGERRLSRPPKTALERNYLTENSSSENRILRPRRKKLPTESPPKRMIICIYIYVKYYLVFFLARCSPAAKGFFSHFRLRGKQDCHGYIMKHVWISAELRGGARRIRRR